MEEKPLICYSQEYVDWLNEQREAAWEKYKAEVKMCATAGITLFTVYSAIANYAKFDDGCRRLYEFVKSLLGREDLTELREQFHIDLNYKGE